MSEFDVWAAVAGAAIGQMVRTTIESLIFKPLGRLWSSDRRKQEHLADIRRNFVERQDALVNNLVANLDEIAASLPSGSSSTDLADDFRVFLEASETTNVVRQGVTIALGQPDTNLTTQILGPVSIVLRATAPKAFGTDRDLAHRVATTLAETIADAIQLLHLPSDFLTEPDLQRSLAVATIQQLTSINNLVELGAAPGVAVTDWYSFPEHYRLAIEQTYSKLPTPHWDGEPRVDSDRIYIPPRFMTSNDAMSSPMGGTSDDRHRVVLLGDPGNGKTSYSSRFVYLLASKRETWDGHSRLPFVVTLRAYTRRAAKKIDGMTFVEFLEAELADLYQIRPPPGAIEFLLLCGRCYMVFDGLDEILDPASRREVANSIEIFGARHDNCPVLVTSRHNGYDNAPLDREQFRVIRLAPFGTDDVERYIANWFLLDDTTPPGKRRNDQKTLTSSLESLEPRLYTNPLTLALLCNLFKAGGYQPLPKSRTEIYEKCSLMLYSRWDRNRGLGHDGFERDFLPVIANLAHRVIDEPSLQAGMTRAKISQLVISYLYPKKYRDLDYARRFADDLVDHCTGRAWVFSSESEDEEGNSLFGFTHRTFLEYFAANYLVRRYASGTTLARALYPWLLAGERGVICDMAFEIKSRTLEDGAEKFVRKIRTLAAAEPEDKQATLLLRLTSMLSWTPVSDSVLSDVVDAAWASTDYPTMLRAVAGWSGENARFANRYVLAKASSEPPARWSPGDVELLTQVGLSLTSRVADGRVRRDWLDFLVGLGAWDPDERPWWETGKSGL